MSHFYEVKKRQRRTIEKLANIYENNPSTPESIKTSFILSWEDG